MTLIPIGMFIVYMHKSEKQLAAEKTRKYLLAAAFDEMYENGYQAASLGKILDKIEVTKGALYHHFKSKKELGLAVIDEVLRKLLQKYWYRPLQEIDNPVKALCKIFQDYIDDNAIYTSVLKKGCPLNNLMQEMSPLDSDFRLCLQNLFNEWVAVIEEAFNRGKKQGSIEKKMRVHEITLFILASFFGTLSIAKNSQSRDYYEKGLKQVQEYIKKLQP